MPKPVRLGETREHTPRGSATGDQHRQTGLGAKTLRATALLPLGFVVAVFTARHGDTPKPPSRPKPKFPSRSTLPNFKTGSSCLCPLDWGRFSL